MRILLSNDDGIAAAGLERLERVARQISDDVWVVAPETDQSGASHSLTLSEPVRARQLSEHKFAVSGTPTDSVLMAVLELIPDKQPDLVLSGINRGSNLGEDVTYSGTVAAAMEGALLGIPSIALSQHNDRSRRTKWATAEHHAPDLVRKLVSVGWPANVLINVNFPDVVEDKVQGVAMAVQGRRKPGSTLDRRLDPRDRPYYWISSARTEEPSLAGSDLAAVHAGLIAVTPLHLDLTHHETMSRLNEALG
ncbi:MAG: 5'/3'-nucleotidase SurE [Alphaproteobacteria bacterium]|nr:5'/3'-nucleotidase SurE [Alphaproteobacteria bacterium]MDP6517986.1 5'/3'-nucleotidase SurE [Alphaproteobacteria bacterium]